MPSERVKFIKHSGREILSLDFSGCTAVEVLPVIDEAKKAIRTRPEGSVLTLTNVTDMRFNENVAQHMKEFTAHNKPYVKAAAVIGVLGIKKILFDAAMMFSRRRLYAFDDVLEAMDWLVKD